MNRSWHPLIQAPSGGTVLQMAIAQDGQAWLASPAGLFHRAQGAWHARSSGLPFPQTGAVACIQGLENRLPLLLAAGLEGGIARSFDSGAVWQSCWIEQARAPVSCFVASPNFPHDAVLLAGTQGDGILRSTDAGRFWHLSNFGLRNFEVYALVSAGEWGWRETVYAGTADGIYVSPNGGRAWKFCGLKGKAVLALAASTEFAASPTLFAGTDGLGLWRSEDAGKTWQPVNFTGADSGASSAPYSVNAIAWVPFPPLSAGDSPRESILLAATAESGILRSTDGGDTWQFTQAPGNDIPSVMCLSGLGSELAAGTLGDGLWTSPDQGRSWRLEARLAARRFQWLEHAPSEIAATRDNPPGPSVSPAFLAGGLSEGLWMASAPGAAWQEIPLWSSEAQAFCLALAARHAWIGAADGVWMLSPSSPADGSEDRAMLPAWQKTLDSDEAITALACDPGRPGQVWAADVAGKMWFSANDGKRWTDVNSPARRNPILALACAAGELLVAVGDESRHEMQFWRASPAQVGQAALDWDLYYAEKTSWRAVRLACGGVSGNQWVIALGNAVVYQGADGWRRSEIAPSQSPLSALAWLPGAAQWVAATPGAMWQAAGPADWHPMDAAPHGIAALLVSGQEDTLFALTVEGNLWKWSL
jgi:hypothetical protein